MPVWAKVSNFTPLLDALPKFWTLFYPFWRTKKHYFGKSLYFRLFLVKQLRWQLWGVWAIFEFFTKVFGTSYPFWKILNFGKSLLQTIFGLLTRMKFFIPNLLNWPTTQLWGVLSFQLWFYLNTTIPWLTQKVSMWS